MVKVVTGAVAFIATKYPELGVVVVADPEPIFEAPVVIRVIVGVVAVPEPVIVAAAMSLADPFNAPLTSSPSTQAE
jgi:hypothetical protein